MKSTLHVLHVTEASSAGVLHSAGQLARLQAELSADVTFAYIPRSDTPARHELKALISPAEIIQFGDREMGLVGRVRALRRFVRSNPIVEHVDVIHLHSSIAGAAGRLGARSGGPLMAYSPHGFAFLRQDVGPAARSAFRGAERMAARHGVVITASQSEQAVARDVIGVRDAHVLLNGVDLDVLPPKTYSQRERPLIGMVGRITYQKAPWKFAELARRFEDRADFIWLGDGPDHERKRWLDGSPVEISGWLTQAEARQRIADLDVLSFGTLWEGMPLSLIDAQAIGVPAVATRIVGNSDVVIDGVTGFLCETDTQFRDAIDRLISDPEFRIQLGRQSANAARARFDARQIASDSLDLYELLLAGIKL